MNIKNLSILTLSLLFLNPTLTLADNDKNNDKVKIIDLADKLRSKSNSAAQELVSQKQLTEVASIESLEKHFVATNSSQSQLIRSLEKRKDLLSARNLIYMYDQIANLERNISNQSQKQLFYATLLSYFAEEGNIQELEKAIQQKPKTVLAGMIVDGRHQAFSLLSEEMKQYVNYSMREIDKKLSSDIAHERLYALSNLPVSNGSELNTRIRQLYSLSLGDRYSPEQILKATTQLLRTNRQSEKHSPNAIILKLYYNLGSSLATLMPAEYGNLGELILDSKPIDYLFLNALFKNPIRSENANRVLQRAVMRDFIEGKAFQTTQEQWLFKSVLLNHLLESGISPDNIKLAEQLNKSKNEALKMSGLNSLLERALVKAKIKRSCPFIFGT